MSDYIEREAAEERLLHMAEVANSAYEGMYNSQIVMLAQNVIHMMPAADVRPKWISVEERLPEKTGTYLAWMIWDLTDAREEPSVYPVEYDAAAGAFGWWKGFYDGETLGYAGSEFIPYEGITHWMPLPESPEGRE